MERIENLISKLNAQFESNADPAQMLATVHFLQTELMKLNAESPKILGTSKVAVMMPSRVGHVAPEHERFAPKVAEEPVKEVKKTALVEKGSVAIVKDNGQLDMVFDPMVEIPTLSQQVNEATKSTSEVSDKELNDKLKHGKTEIFEFLKETPIKDLRKAIGINDRFLFIDELFRGDEAMYERSIKTINSFNIYAEAEYWISRELKVKIGWNNDSKTVMHFDQIVKRRFT